MKYYIVTAVRNEEKYIAKTIESVIKQTVLPEKWYIINDNSSDGTEEIIRNYSLNYTFIELLHGPKNTERNFSSKVFALKVGFNAINKRHVGYDLLGILDGDIELPPYYYEKIIEQFNLDSKLGLAAGILRENINGTEKIRGWRTWSISGGIQLFRRECFEQIGGLMPLKYGREDSAAETSARMHSWHVKAFKTIQGVHLKPTDGAAENLFLKFYRLGKRDYYSGVHPLYFLIRTIARFYEHPMILNTFIRIFGFIVPPIKGEKCSVPEDLLKYQHKEQLKRIFIIIKQKIVSYVIGKNQHLPS